MKAMILAAGLGTRLRPWTLEHPKALVPVDGVPMLERVIGRMCKEGFDEIIVNIHHFGDQIIDFVNSKDFGVKLTLSDERGLLLDTGGALVKAHELLGDGPVLVHNVDILSNAGLSELMSNHESHQAGCTLLVSDRESSRKLIFDREMRLKGWHHLGENLFKPENLAIAAGDNEYAFSGIYVASGEMRDEMRRLYGDHPFPVMDYLLDGRRKVEVRGQVAEGLRLIDIGKPSTLASAQSWL